MKVNNETDRPIYASLSDGEWYEIPVGESIDVTDAHLAQELLQYGATMSNEDRTAALSEAAGDARRENSLTASASVSEGEAQARVDRQRTVDVSSGGVMTGGTTVVDPNAGKPVDPDAAPADENVDPAALKGAELDKALDDRSLSKTGTADEKRDRIAQYEKAQAELREQAGSNSGEVTPDGSTPQE